MWKLKIYGHTKYEKEWLRFDSGLISVWFRFDSGLIPIYTYWSRNTSHLLRYWLKVSVAISWKLQCSAPGSNSWISIYFESLRQTATNESHWISNNFFCVKYFVPLTLKFDHTTATDNSRLPYFKNSRYTTETLQNLLSNGNFALFSHSFIYVSFFGRQLNVVQENALLWDLHDGFAIQLCIFCTPQCYHFH